jgi:predicted DNA-binding transcriptional regulator AlpA
MPGKDKSPETGCDHRLVNASDTAQLRSSDCKQWRSNLIVQSYWRGHMNKLLREGEVATLLRVSVVTLRRWRMLRQGPPYFHLGRNVRYSLADIENWLNTRADGATDNARPK